MITSLGEALRSRPFSIVVELVPSDMKREAEVLEIASRLATIPDVVAGSITSYVGGRFGQNPVRVGSAVRARGLTPNIHLTCVTGDRAAMQKTLRELRALGMLNVFALTGDWPTEQGAPPVLDLDSVQLVEMIAQQRATESVPFHISVAVSPFEYTREACLDQYQKLERKIAAGADLAITQAGWDARKFAELKRYVDERSLDIPLLGNVHVLGRRAAERMATANRPGVWASPELVEDVRRESEGPDGGLAARLERAARTVAVLQGLGYAGAYIGGTHSCDDITHIIERARELAPTWEECAEQLRYGSHGGFYLDQKPTPANAARTLLR